MLKYFWELLDNQKKIYAILVSISLIVGFLIGIFASISNLPFIPAQLKVGMKLYKASESLSDIQMSTASLVENIVPMMTNPNERLICVSNDEKYIVSLNSAEAMNFQPNIKKLGANINLENCRLLSDLEKENFDISEGWGQKLAKRL
ncbi:hypothetical protein E0765_04525 [Sulfuricurvum sp. IAE1]|uniref:hypothetical protein n=1 Tax=Sulfuricurvum sp. IAE1 TaxID=2546102 RepID=UPI00104471F7|nr:hypothetical protein [Sulfuricurvum sp. IAE1]TDA67177.1 hypothetical protein E0765_04525 [Sulfuricurvum sp. IAE1]